MKSKEIIFNFLQYEWSSKFVQDLQLFFRRIFFNYKNRGGSRAAATSKMERFVIIINIWKMLFNPDPSKPA